MKTIYLFLTLLFAANITMAQNQTNILESSPYIQVSGDAEKEVIPDEIYLQFTLQERYDGKNKVQLDDLETELKQLLRKNDFNLENLTLADANADYITIKRKKKDVLASKDFEVKVATTGQLTNVWNILDEVQAQNAYVSRVDHSQMEELKKEVKIMAVKNAKDKATYLLSAVDEKIGRVLYILEQTSYIQPYMRKSQVISSVSMIDMEREETLPEISFQKITLKYTVSARFAIE